MVWKMYGNGVILLCVGIVIGFAVCIFVDDDAPITSEPYELSPVIEEVYGSWCEDKDGNMVECSSDPACVWAVTSHPVLTIKIPCSTYFNGTENDTAPIADTEPKLER